MSLDKNSLESVSEVDKRTNFWYFCFVVRVDHRDCYHWKSFFFLSKTALQKLVLLFPHMQLKSSTITTLLPVLAITLVWFLSLRLTNFCTNFNIIAEWKIKYKLYLIFVNTDQKNARYLERSYIPTYWQDCPVFKSSE